MPMRPCLVFAACVPLLSQECLATPTTLGVDSVVIMHDGRSIAIEAHGSDPGDYGAVDWVPGWFDGAAAEMYVPRTDRTVQIIFTGAIIKRTSGSPSGTLTWQIYALGNV